MLCGPIEEDFATSGRGLMIKESFYPLPRDE
jgi:hypothetical protein